MDIKSQIKKVGSTVETTEVSVEVRMIATAQLGIKGFEAWLNPMI